MNLFTYLKTRIAILDVINEYTSLKKAGLYWKGQCPFHSEKTASFTVSPHKEIYYCFGCHAGGDVISFIARAEQCTQIEAAKHLVDRYQIELPASLASEWNNKKTDQSKQYYAICELLADWCHEQLAKSSVASDYLASRGITANSIKAFSIGYFPSGLAKVKELVTYMSKNNILVDDLLDAHILNKGKNVLFSPFEDRIIFPITDHLGRHCGFGGRVFKPNDTRPKYYNSHENEHFAKGQLLFGLDHAKREIQKNESVFLVEGYTDCIAMAQYGYPNTVATLGTACTLDHLTILSRYAQQMYVLYDGDNAGQQAILRIGQLAWQASVDLKVISLPAAEDPASYLAKNKNLGQFVQNAVDIVTFYIQTLGSDFMNKPLPQKLALTRKIIDIISKLDDPLKQDILLENAAQKLALPFESLKKELRRMQASPTTGTPKAPRYVAKTPDLPDMSTYGPLENKIFFSIINNIMLMTSENEEFLVTYLPHPLCDILKRLQEEKSRVRSLGFIQFFEALSPEYQQFVSKTLLQAQDNVQPIVFEQLVTQLQRKHWKVIVNNIKIKLEAAKKVGNETEIAHIMHDFSQLRRKIIGNMLPEQEVKP
jgi:DNA primase